MNFVQTHVQGQETCSYGTDIGPTSDRGEPLYIYSKTGAAQVLENDYTLNNTPRLEVGVVTN